MKAIRPEVLDMETWENTYDPIVNHMNNNASFQDEQGNGIMFETYGVELDYIFSYPHEYVWTLIDSDSLHIRNGYHWVDRLGYFITKKPWDKSWIVVDLEWLHMK